MKVLILSSSTGGGHDMRAKAFVAWTQRAAAVNLTTKIHQTLEKTHKIYRFGVNLYNWIQHTAPVLHHIYFNFLEVAGLFTRSKKIIAAQRFQKVVEEMKPDLIISVHGSLNHGFFEIARRTLKPNRVYCVTYCGELSGGYGFSRHWVNPSADLFIGAVEETREAAIRLGMSPQKTQVGGFLLEPSFYEPAFNENIRYQFIQNELELDPQKFILLLSTGATGANNHLAFLKVLHRARLDIQAVILCGKSSSTINLINRWVNRHRSFPVKLLPYTNQMRKLMQCVSAVVTRPGTGTTSEAILSNCPIIFNGIGGVMPQERITLKYCYKYRLAEIVWRPNDLVIILSRLLKNPKEIEKLRGNMMQKRPTQHPLDILKNISQLPNSSS